MLLFGLSLSVPLQAEPLFRFHGITDVLPSLSISSIVQDSRGFLWYGTQGGLVMYNGNEYTTRTSIPFADNTLSSNLVQTMYMDKNDVLWIGTYAGLDRFDIATGSFTNYSVGSDVVVSILRDSTGRLWAGTLGGLACLKPGADQFILYTKDDEARYIADNTVRNLYESSAGKIYASTYHGLYEYDPRSDSFGPCTLLLPGNPASEGVIYGIQEDGNGDYWAAKWGTGLIRIDHETLEYTVFPLADNRIYCMSATFSPDVILAGTWGGGLNVLYPKTGEVSVYTQQSKPGHKLTNDIVYSMFTDDNGLLWLGTNGGGLNVHDPRRSWFYSLEATLDGSSGLATGKITGIMEDNTGDLWISVTNKGITRYNPVTETFRHYRAEPSAPAKPAAKPAAKSSTTGNTGPKPGTLPTDIVYCFLQDSRNDIYVGTEKGLLVYDEKKDTFSPVEWFQSIGFRDPQQNIASLSEGKDGSLWIGTYANGIIRYFPETGAIVRYVYDENDSRSVSDNLIYFTETDSTGEVWIGTNKGLNRFDPETGFFTRYLYDRKNRTGISSNTVYAFYEHTDGSLWFGTRNGGLCAFDRASGTFSHVMTSDGLPSDTIVGLAPSHGDLFWAATQNGLVQYDAVKKSIFIYKASDGLLSQQFNTANALARDGTRYFGTPAGLVYFTEKDLAGSSISIPAMALTSLMINNEHLTVPYVVDFPGGIKLAPEQENINFGFTALDFSPLARYSYSYKLDGFDEDWIHAGDRKYAMYTNLNPGRYLFRVRVDSPDDGENGKETVFPFSIETPLFLRWYALLAYFSLLVLAAYLAFKIRNSMLLEKKIDELEAETTNLQSANTHLEVLSYQDSLTQIPNRRYLEYIIVREWEAAKVRKDFLSVLMLDIDFFKLYNDTYGHLAGDETLKKVASAIQSALFRVSDVVARYGGEEFIVVLPDTNRENAQVVCDRIMQGIALCDIPFKTDIGANLSISIGCYTGIPDSELTYEKFILKADEALYQAKKDGRNRTSIYNSSNSGL